MAFIIQMRKRIFSLAAALSIAMTGVFPQTPVDHVNVFIGTEGDGATIPSVTAPFGMTQWCASTRMNHMGHTAYGYSDSTFVGFMGSHQPTVWMGDYGFMTLMPQTGRLRMGMEERRVRLCHDHEQATPYSYSLTYDGGTGKMITTEFTATSRAALFHVDYPAGDKAILCLEAGREGDGGGIEILPERREVRIYNRQVYDTQKGLYLAEISPEVPGFKGYYVLKFSSDFADFGTWADGAVDMGGTVADGVVAGGYVVFPEGTRVVDIRIGSSFIDFAQAQDNLDREIPESMSLREAEDRVKGQWNDLLGRVRISDATADELAMFYTAMFHSFQFPREFSEYGRYYSAFDGKIHDGVSYNDFSLWDTFRAEHPWLLLMLPERTNDMVQSLVQMYREGGWLPKWPNPTYTSIMIGTHADAVIADAYVNGLRGFDIDVAYEAMLKDAYCPPARDNELRWGDRQKWTSYEARGGLTSYLERGYVASDKTEESVSRTLEFAFDDFCIAQMARGLGKRKDYKDLMAHSANYRNLFDSETGFFQARRGDGSWDSPDIGFCEGPKWTYQFCVMQDVPGLISLMGGRERFMSLLDDVFEQRQYVHENEPCHHYAYLYNYCDELARTQARIPAIIKANYKNTPRGLSGNDDCGQMSAWYIFSCLGFYPVAPASGEYALGIPAFKRVEVDLPGDKTLIVKADELASGKPLTDVRLNGRRLPKPFVRVRDIMKGGVLEFRSK